MKRNWNDIAWMFEPDGALRDIYVQEVTLHDWGKTIDLINEKYTVLFGDIDECQDSNFIDKDYVFEYLMDESGEKECKIASILLGDIRLNCFFFLADEIEFDIDPKEITSAEDFALIEAFMVDLSRVLDNQVTLTDENEPTLPWVKVDVNRGIQKVLTAQDLEEYRDNANTLMDKMKSLMTKVEMKWAPGRFRRKVMESASELHVSTKKDKNVW